MNKALITGIVVAVILAVGVGIYSSISVPRNDAVMMEKEKMEKEAMEKEAMMKAGATKKEEAMMDKGTGETMVKDEQTMMKVGSYVPYSASKVAMAATGDVVLFFRAGWCPTCRTVDSDIRSHLKDIPESLTILDVNYDNSADLKKKYGVTYQHTFVQVDAQGNLIKKWSGSPTLSALVAEVQ
jgi:thiol-disulfide isomerase/thioredoxin